MEASGRRVSIQRLFNHVVRVYREPDAEASRDALGGVELRPLPTGPVPTEYNGRPHQAWQGTMQDKGPGEQQAAKRLWFLDPTMDVQERDVLSVIAGPEAGLLVRAMSVVPVSTRRTVHHLEVSTEPWVGELPEEYS